MKPFDFIPTFLLAVVNDRFYSVPRYQRSFAWTDEMVKDFWLDMKRAIADDREHFLGNIVLSAESGDGTLSIVDGQQRIVTTTLLLAALRDEFREAGDERTSNALARYVGEHNVKTFQESPRVRMNPDDNPFYKSNFVDGLRAESTRESHDLLRGAYDFFKLSLSELRSASPSSWKEEFSKITRFLDEQARIVVVQAPTDADAFAIFETLNDRGADLTISDLLKNLLFSRAKKEIDVVQQLWLEARTIIEELKPKTDMMTFLRHYWSSRHGATRERDLYREIKNTINTSAESLSFAQTLREDAAFYRALLTPTDDHWKGYSPTAKAALQTFDRLSLEQIRPMLLALYRHFTVAEAQKAAKSVLNWAVRGIVAGVIGGGKAESYFCTAAIKIRAGSIKSVTELLTELKELIPNDALFRENLERYRTTNNSFARYLLYGLERKLMNEKEPELVPNQNVDEVNLEHVLPQKGKPSEWPAFTAETIPIMAYRLGNMTLLQKGPNGKIGNKPWSIKRPILSKSKLKLNDVFKARNDWTPAEINDRQVELAKLGPSVWPLAQ